MGQQISDVEIIKLRPSLSGEKLLIKQQQVAKEKEQEEAKAFAIQENMIDDVSLQRPLSPKASEVQSFNDYDSSDIGENANQLDRRIDQVDLF